MRQGMNRMCFPELPDVGTGPLAASMPAKSVRLPPLDAGRSMTPQEEGTVLGQFTIIADCGPYKILSQKPPGEHSNFWTFEITGPGFYERGTSWVGTDETCGRSIIGGLATAWRAGRIQGRREGETGIRGVLKEEDPCQQSL